MSVLAQVEAEDLGSRCLVRVSGEIDLSNAQEVLDRIASSIPTGARVVLLDLSQTVYLDSSGIAMIFRLAQRLSNARQDLRLVVPRDARIRAVIDLTDVGQVVPVDETFTDAATAGLS
jgi:anti-anti-sigma factor